MLRTLLLALAFTATAHAQTAPKGWAVDATANAWTASAPDKKVRLAFYPAVKNASSFVFWFEDEGLRRTYAYGRKITNQDASKATTDPDAGPFLAQARMLDISGAPVAVLSYAWQTPKGKQMAQIILPSTSQDSPAYKAAFAEITSAWKSRFAYVPAPKPAP